MAELNGYTLTKEEEKACLNLIKKMRKKRAYELGFTGYVSFKAKNEEEVNELFWEWADEVKELTIEKFGNRIYKSPIFELVAVDEILYKD